MKKSSVAKSVNDPLKFVRQFAPSLTAARASLLPFEDVISEESAGPQDDSNEPPFFEVWVDDPNYSRLCATVTADGVTMVVADMVDGEVTIIDSWQCQIGSLWDYLRQLPRPARSFVRR